MDGFVHTAYAGGVDLTEEAQGSPQREDQEGHIDFTDESQRYPAGEGDASEATIETELFGAPRRIEGEEDGDTVPRIHISARSIVVTIPKGKLEEIKAEEADVAKREEGGEQGIQYYWQMGRLPAEVPERIYFLWDGSIRAYHNVTGIDRKDGRLYMDTVVHALQAPVPMASFRGFRYLRDVPAGKTADIGHDLFELTDSDPIRSAPTNPLVQNPSQTGVGGGEGLGTSGDQVGRDNVEEDPDMHLGSKDDHPRSSTNPTFDGTSPADGDWQYEPDLSSNLTTVRDDAGEFASDSDYRSPFVRVYERLNR